MLNFRISSSIKRQFFEKNVVCFLPIFPFKQVFYNKGAAYSKVQVSMAVGVDRNMEPTHDSCFTKKLFWKCSKNSEENISDGLQFFTKIALCREYFRKFAKTAIFSAHFRTVRQWTVRPLDQ